MTKADITRRPNGCSEPLAAGLLLRQGEPLDLSLGACLDLQMWKKSRWQAPEPQRDL
jgi:hypothetical protein